MATSLWQFVRTMVAGEDLSDTNDLHVAISPHTTAGQGVKSAANSSTTIGFLETTGRVAGGHIRVNTGDSNIARAGAAISAGAALQIGTGGKVITATGTNPVIGYANEAAAGDNSILRITFRGKPAANG